MRCVGPISGMTSSGPTLAADGTPFVNVNPAANREGSAVPSEVFNILLRELTHLVEFAAIVPSADDSDLQQVRKAVLKLIASAAVPAATTETAGIVRLATAEEVAEKTEPNAAVSPADLAGLDGMPVGALLDLYGDDSEAPPGYLLCNGAAVTATYPELRAFGLDRGWQVNAAGDPLLPDSGGYFRRGWRTGQVVDSGRVFGTVQGDAIRNITGRFGGLVGDPVGDGAFKTAEHYTGSGGYSNTNYSITFDVSNVVPTAADNRPVNYPCTTWIKAYPAATSPGSLDLANLVNDITDVEQRTTALETGYSARAWVAFNGTGTVSVRGSGNVSSVTDITTAGYRVNFAAPLPDALFAALATAGNLGAAAYNRQILTHSPSVNDVSVVASAGTTGAALDLDLISLAVFR